MMATGSVQPRPGVTQYEAREGAPVFLSDMIIELGLAETEHVESAVETARSSGETVGRILVREGRLSEDQLARALAARYGLSHIDLNEFEVDPDAANLLPPAAAERYKAVPVGFEMGGGLLVAMADPSDSLAISDIAFMTRLDVQAAVAAADLIKVLVASLPLPPNETRGPAFTEHSVPPAPEPDPVVYEQQPYPPAPPEPLDPGSRIPDPGPPAPAVDSGELPALRAEIEQLNSLLDSERSKHAEMIAELKQQQVSGDESLRTELEGARHDLEGARNELEGTRHELEAARQERDQARGDLDHTRGELEHARGELDNARGELDTTRGELDTTRGDLDNARRELDTTRGDLDSARSELETMRTELEQAREAAARAGEAEGRMAELEEAEQRIAETHSTVERMRNEFELERETHAATERDLRGRLASETEQRDALQEAQASLQKRMDVLRTQNAALLDAYATAKRWSAEFARSARELANTLEQPVLDDAVRGQQQPPEKDKPADDDAGREGGRFAREDGEEPQGGGGAVPPNWFS
jgi:predicted  nucleic acid-binding Zn-ribbon protein